MNIIYFDLLLPPNTNTSALGDGETIIVTNMSLQANITKESQWSHPRYCHPPESPTPPPLYYNIVAKRCLSILHYVMKYKEAKTTINNQ